MRLSRRHVIQGAGTVGVGLLVGCGRWPGQAGPPKVPRVGLLFNVGRRDGSSVEAIINVLRDHGYLAEQNTIIEFRSADGQVERLPALASELAQLPVDVMLAAGPPAVRAARDATSTIPIVMQYTADPVADGVVASLARPGGNVTGVTAMGAQLAGKRLELLKETIPHLSRVAVLTVASRITGDAELEAAAQILGLRLQLLAVNVNDLEGAFDAMTAHRADAVLLNGAGGTGLALPRIVDLATQRRLPVMSEDRVAVSLGGLLSYGANFTALYGYTASYLVKILQGAKPADLPVEQPREFDLVINVHTAQALGVTIPHHVLLQATEVIQ
jgi:putative tryptophan/tyrosine transport system substrate-binding protein